MENWVENSTKCNPFKLASFVSSRMPSQSTKTCNAIGDLLPLTLIEMEHVQEIKLSLSYCNEILSIMILFTSQSDKMIKLKLNQGLAQCHHSNLLALLFQMDGEVNGI